VTPSHRRAAFAALTFLTLLYAGMFHWVLYEYIRGVRVPLWAWSTVAGGLWYAGSMAAILGAHEAGHAVTCWRHGIPFTGPYFLPGIFPLIGTSGAFIRVHSPYPTRTALIRVGIAGPVAGMVVIVPCVVVGLWWSSIVDMQASSNVVRFGRPWLMTAFSSWILGPGPVSLHPLAIAGWVGCLFTMLNLIPFRQFDGGHIVRAAFGPKVALVCSWVSMLGAFVLAVRSVTWAAIAIIMALDWHRIDEPLDTAPPRFRWGYVLAAAALFGMCWNQIDLRWNRT